MTDPYDEYRTPQEGCGTAIAGLVAMVAIGVMVLFSSCKTCVPVVETIEKEKIVEVHTRDTAIVTKADSASIRALLYCDSAYNVVVDELAILQGWHINANAHTQQTNGGLVIEMDCKTDSLVNEIQLRDSVIREMEKHTQVVQVEVVKPFYRGCTIALWILVALLAVGVTIRILVRVYLKK